MFLSNQTKLKCDFNVLQNINFQLLKFIIYYTLTITHIFYESQ
jgi:hypothetical protein